MNATEATARSDEYLEKGQLVGQGVWLLILKAIGVLLDDVPNGAKH